MDVTIANIILVTAGGFGTGGLVTFLAGGLVSRAAASGITEGDGGVRPILVRPWCWPFCPPLAGGLAAMILGLVYGPALDPAGTLAAVCALSAVGGTAGATASICLQSALIRH